MIANWKPEKYRSEKYLNYIRSLPCCVCGFYQAEAHHVGFKGGKGMGTKVDDTRCISLCHVCHMEGHNSGWDSFQTRHNIDIKAIQIIYLEGYIRIIEKKGGSNEGDI